MTRNWQQWKLFTQVHHKVPNFAVKIKSFGHKKATLIYITKDLSLKVKMKIHLAGPILAVEMTDNAIASFDSSKEILFRYPCVLSMAQGSPPSSSSTETSAPSALRDRRDRGHLGPRSPHRACPPLPWQPLALDSRWSESEKKKSKMRNKFVLVRGLTIEKDRWWRWVCSRACLLHVHGGSSI